MIEKDEANYKENLARAQKEIGTLQWLAIKNETRHIGVCIDCLVCSISSTDRDVEIDRRDLEVHCSDMG